MLQRRIRRTPVAGAQNGSGRSALRAPVAHRRPAIKKGNNEVDSHQSRQPPRSRVAALVAAGRVGPPCRRLCRRPSRGTSRRGSSGQRKAGLTITFLPKNLGNPYFDTATPGGKEAVEEFGGTYSEVGPVRGEPRRARCSYINTAAQQGAGVIVVSANDPNAICDALNEAREAGVEVVTSTPTPTRTAATCSSTRPRPRASPRSRST